MKRQPRKPNPIAKALRVVGCAKVVPDKRAKLREEAEKKDD
jgi:hypothetical protein